MKKHSDLSFVYKIEELRAIPPIVTELMGLLNDTSTPIYVIEEKIKMDEAITSYLLKLCNSPLFGFKSHIDTISHGLKMLGFSRCKSILISYFLRNLYDKPSKKYIAYYLWEHSLYVAFAARELAINLNLAKRAEEAYIAGLLHDIGKLVIYFFNPETYEELIHEADGKRKSILPLEYNVYGFSHVETGYHLMNNWKFSDLLKDSVRYHHNISDYPGKERVVHLVAFANCTVHYAIDKREELPGQFLELFELPESEYNEIVEKILHLLVQSCLF